MHLVPESSAESKAERRSLTTPLNEEDVVNQFLEHADDGSFTALFQVFSPQLVAFFRRRGHQIAVAEDLAQEVMLTAYQRAGQIRDRKLFRAWLFTVARNTACRYFARLGREIPTVDLAELGDRFATTLTGEVADGPDCEFREWMTFLEPREREMMTLRFIEGWEYHEIASAHNIPIGTVQWRVFNSKKNSRHV